MAAQQKRLITAEKSKLGKLEPAELANLLRKDGAWSTLPIETRQNLYALLPAPQPSEPPHNFDVNPLQSRYRSHIEEELGRWQEDLKNGLETKKYREEAYQAGRDRTEGRFDEWKESQREEFWGDSGKVEEDGENVAPKSEDGGKGGAAEGGGEGGGGVGKASKDED